MHEIGTSFCPYCNRMVDTVSFEVTGRRRSWSWIVFFLVLSLFFAFGICIFPVSVVLAVVCFGCALYLFTHPTRRAQKCIYCHAIIA